MAKKGSQERLASMISGLSDITLNDDDGLPNLMCAKCKPRVESLENQYLGSEVAEGHENTPLYYPDKFTISSPKSDVT